MKNKTNNRTHILLRYIIVMLLIALLAVAIAVKVVKTTVIDADKWNEKAEKYLSGVVTIPPERGNILACDGSVLATNLRYYTVRVDYRSERFKMEQYKRQLDTIADSMAHYFPIKNKAQWLKHLKAPLEREKLPRAYRLLRNISYADYMQLRKLPFFDIPNRNRNGIVLEPVDLRKKPYGAMARRSIGSVNEDSATGEFHGISGLEKALDTILYGKPGLSKKIALTKNIVDWADVKPVRGYDILTTIDIKMQDILENELNKVLELCNAEWGTAILMDVKTGDIKAISNLELHKSGKYIEGMNRAVLGYEPGSVVKTLSMLIALEEGAIRDTSMYISTGSSFAFAGGRPITDAHGVAGMRASEVLEMSSNIGMTKITAIKYGNDPVGFRNRVAETGFFDPMNTGIAGETTPRYPILDNSRRSRIAMSRMCYGYTTEISPMSMLAVYNAIANDGKYVRPRLVKGLSRDGVDSIIPVSYIRPTICSERNAKILQAMLKKVVWGKHGTGKMLRDKRVPIAGKTGTCYVIENGHYNTSKRRLAFCGFFPADNPMYSCAVLVCNPRQYPRGAASTSGTVLKNTALMMYSRGMLDNSSDYKKSPVSDVPISYATRQESQRQNVKKELGVNKLPRLTTPAKVEGGVPNVLGMGIVEALSVLEEAGYNVQISGHGYVKEQTPQGGAELTVGSVVKLKLTSD